MMTAEAMPYINLHKRSSQKLFVKKKGTVAMVITKFERRIERRRPQSVNNLDPMEPRVNPRMAAVEMYSLF